ncbi:hypothetical protein GCM10022222_49520 [Amycolatopsis ultiminotia]|uniref:Uncharacterized protein n=1 Tax=Amycolatopsis ultiminotia TaxID=543629 RepID=A0ABP6X187_9PSEU
MTDALVMGGILLALMRLTQVGRHRHTLFLGIMPFVSCATIGLRYFVGGIAVTGHNLVPGVAGMVLGAAACGSSGLPRRDADDEAAEAPPADGAVPGAGSGRVRGRPGHCAGPAWRWRRIRTSPRRR